ncbi:MAG: sulfotransferase [Pseudomonadota bacterium]
MNAVAHATAQQTPVQLAEPARPPRVVAGSGRGGTTWILDALARENALRPVFEPLHPQGVPSAAGFAYACDDGNAMPDGCEAFFTDVFNGRLHTLWSNYRVRRDRLTPRLVTLSSTTLVRQFYRRWRKLGRNRAQFRPLLAAEQCLVKLIRGNLMLDWLHERFAARTVLVVRHPGAVVESQMRLSGNDWDPQRILAAYTSQPAFAHRYGARCSELLAQPMSKAQAHAAVWCIENQLPLESRQPGSFRVVFYEKLLEAPEREWRRMADWLELPNVPSEAVRKAPSQQVSEVSKGERLDLAHKPGWMQRLEQGDRNQVQAVLTAFGVEAYRMDDPMPADCSAATNDS